MEPEQKKRRIAILGGGPSGLFIYKRFVESGNTDFEIEIFEKHSELGAGMPYSKYGANDEHVTNVSDNEIPHIVNSIEEWIQTAPKTILERFDVDPQRFNEYKVLPRLLFGQYLSGQFKLLQDLALEGGISTRVHYESTVTDIIDDPANDQVLVEIAGGDKMRFDTVVICTGHNWPVKREGIIPGYFDAPYPPAKLALNLNHTIAIKGSSLTAIDAIRTLARHNGSFEKDADGKLSFKINSDSPDFKMVMHSRSGMLPAVRFHLEDSHLSNDSLLTEEEIDLHRRGNGGFLSLDFVFQKDFKELFREKDAEFYDRIKDWDIEQFVEEMMQLRENLEPFQLFKAEYVQAEKSIKRHQSIYWKEMLAVLSFAMNYPAKYLSAEDMQRLQKVLMPLISIVIAFVPQRSCIELLALHDAGVLDIIAVGSDSTIEPQTTGGIIYHFKDGNTTKSIHYKTFVDCVGQPHLSYADFPFKSLISQKAISPARLQFQSAELGQVAFENGNKAVEKDNNDNYYLNVSGISINDDFQIIDQYGAYNSRIYIMAVPYIGGFNPDYSGLDFCEAASAHIIKNIVVS